MTRNGTAQATPTFDPVAGAIAFGTDVTITSAGADAIYYTINGSTPTTGSTLYSGPVDIPSALTLKALAVKAGLDDSAIGSAAYTQAATADLSGLVLSGSPTGYTFAGGTYTYNSVSVANGVATVTITPTGTGTITVEGQAVTSGQASQSIALTAGVEKPITIVATETGKSAKTYIINVTRAGAAQATADLSGLVLSGSPTGYTFAGTVYSYGLGVENNISSITVTPTGAGTITVDGNAVTSGNASDAISLTAGVEKSIVIVATETGKSAKTYTFKIMRAQQNQMVPEPGTNTMVNNATPEILVTSPTEEVIMTVSSGTSNPTLDYGMLITNGAGAIPPTTINSDVVTVSIPESTITSSNTSWNGVMTAPTLTTVELPVVADEVKTVALAIEIGNDQASLSFDNAVRILFPGQAGKKVGYIKGGGEFTEITTVGTTDSQTAGNALPADGALKIDVGSDLVVWTKHFTKFVTYTQKSTIASISSATYTIDANTISNVPAGTDKTTFLAALTKGHAGQVWNDTGIDATVASGNTLVSTAEDETTAITYTITVNTGLTAGSIGSAQFICVSGTPARLTQTTEPTGGSGTFTYQWQKSTTSASTNFSDISAATSSDYTPGNLSETTWYKRLVSSPGFNADPVASNVIAITIVPAISDNSIQTPLQTGFCQSADPLTLTGRTPSGGSGTYTYQWQSSSNGITFSNISGSTSKDHITVKLTDTTYYRRQVSSGSCTSVSNSIAINITNALSTNTITAPATTDFDSSGDPERITGNVPTNGNGNYVYQWQRSIISTSNGFENISGATSLDYDPGLITQTTYYRRQVTYGSCTFSTNVVTINVQQDVENNIITYNTQTTFCVSGDPAIITGSLPTGGNGSYTYQWRISTTSVNSGFIDIIGATSKDYDPGIITQSTWFRREVTSGTYQYLSNVISMTIIPAVTNIISADQTIPTGTIPAGLSGGVPTGGNGVYTYLWESKTSSSLVFAPAAGNNTSQNYTIQDALTQTTQYRRKVTSGVCGTVLSNTVQITVTPPNRPPVTSNDSYTVSANTSLNLQAAAGVLQNDTDPDNNSLTANIVTQPAYGILILNPDGSFTYTPTVNFIGTDSFTYGVCDNGIPSLCSSNAGTVTLIVTGAPAIAVTKSAGNPVLQSDGTFNLPFTITVKNTGSIALNDVQVEDDLLQAFPAPLTFKMLGPPLVSGTGLKVNTLFNGSTTKHLLGYGSTLAIGTSGTITLTVNVDIHGNPGAITNAAMATANGQGIAVSGNVSSDPVSLNGIPRIGIAKSVSTPQRQPDGKNSNILTYAITVKNYGNVPLSNVQVSDDLSKAFPSPTTFTVQGMPVSSSNILKINTGFDGFGNTNLLRLNNVLQVGQIDTIKFTVKVTPANEMMGPFDNSALASAKDPGGNSVSDISSSGTNPDPDNNGNPDESSLTRVMLEKVTVRIPEGFSPDGDGVNDTFVLENLDNEPISLQIFNSFGNLIYKNDNYQNDWNGISNQGSYKGKDITDGTYFYVVSKRDNKETYVRFITIIR